MTNIKNAISSKQTPSELFRNNRISTSGRGLTVPEEPDAPMKDGIQNLQKFLVTRTKRSNCPLLKTESSTTYNVLKRSEVRGGKTHVYFYAVHGNDKFAPNPEVTQEDREKDRQIARTHRYLNQVGFANCHQGYVLRVDVNQNGRRCGIGTVLSMLCFLDPEVYTLGEENAATKILEDAPDTEVADWIKEKCEGLVALQMKANPPRGAKTYFDAALKTGFEFLAILWSRHQKLSIYTTKSASSNFRENTGSIGACDGNNEECNAYNVPWIFCINNFL